MVEDDEEGHRDALARDLTSLLQVPGAESLRALVIGRFQRASRIERAGLEKLFSVHPVLESVPVLADVDFGHTSPLATIPIGGDVGVHAGPSDPRLIFPRH